MTKRRQAAGIGVALMLLLGAAAAQATDLETGAELYSEYCAQCHGPDGRGGGEAVEFTDTDPANLRTLARRNGGNFPFERIIETVDGRLDLEMHGGRYMPVWGEVFAFDEESGDALAHARILNLVWFLYRMQDE